MKSSYRRSIRASSPGAVHGTFGFERNKLAEALDVDPGRINRVVTRKSSITADTALRLARYFGTTPQVWMNLQSKYELDVARAKKAAEIEKNVQIRPRDEVAAHELPRS